MFYGYAHQRICGYVPVRNHLKGKLEANPTSSDPQLYFLILNARISQPTIVYPCSIGGMIRIAAGKRNSGKDQAKANGGNFPGGIF